MASLNDLYFKLETLETLVSTLKKKGDKGISLTISISDTANDYGQNVSSYVSQSKDDRDAKKNKFYVGNGKTFWTDGKITAMEKKGNNSKKKEALTGSNDFDEDKLPF